MLDTDVYADTDMDADGETGTEKALGWKQYCVKVSFKNNFWLFA